MDLIFALSKNTVKIELSTALISGILGMLPSFGVKIEDNLVKGIQGIVESLDAGASVSVNLHDVVLRVDVDTNCLGLGVWLGYPMIGTSFIEGVLAPVESNPDISSISTKRVTFTSNWSLQFAIASPKPTPNSTDFWATSSAT